MQKLINNNGITIRQLKELVKDLPEANDSGEEFEVWIGTPDDKSNVCKSIWPLNKSNDGQDLIFEPSPSLVDEKSPDEMEFSITTVKAGIHSSFNGNDKPIDEVFYFIDEAIAALQRYKSSALLRKLTK